MHLFNCTLPLRPTPTSPNRPQTCVNFSVFLAFQVGFNAGNGTQAYEYKPYSQNMVIRDLANRGWANGFPGRHIFRVDEQILIGSCNKDIGMF